MIPRFLLPQLTWQKTAPLALTKWASPVSNSIRDTTSQRSITSQVRPWKQPQFQRNPQYQGAPARSKGPQRHSGVAVSVLSQLSPRSFHTTPPLYRDHHFDTLKFVQRLKDEGFSEDQATAMMRVLSDVIEESIQNLTRTMVLREGTTRILQSPADTES